MLRCKTLVGLVTPSTSSGIFISHQRRYIAPIVRYKHKFKTSKTSIEEVLTPWHNVPYVEQLYRKRIDTENMMIQLLDLLKTKRTPKWALESQNHLACPVEDVIPSPDVDHYRNAATFAVGLNQSGDICVGSVLTQGVIVDPSKCLHTTQDIDRIRSFFQRFVQSYRNELDLPLKPYTRDHRGVWRMIEARHYKKSNRGFAMLQISSNEMSSEELRHLKEKLVEVIDADESGKEVIQCLALQIYNGVSVAPVGTPYEVLWGDLDQVYEYLSDQKFLIRPNSFFQVNVAAAESMFQSIQKWTGGKNVTLLDLCCGTGVIGISLARTVKRVFGIDIVPDAIASAHLNQKINGVQNAKYICGDIVQALPNLLKDLKIEPEDDIVAVLDPPRAGVPKKVIQAIRGCDKINRLIYISCKEEGGVQNGHELCKISTLKTRPFVPVTSFCVDMFPHTAHKEVIILYERSTGDDGKKGFK
ncbi:hypothetical protein PROFUN_01766 [Planoprotostelium fungivorum]|uniref:Uncharacterized protein n=1 Tax=Planoprotostelium fungivorum TaxID=1890364 RepID=A0A2P6MWG2_9EUKA|nr:hypothetical protein PROFUN_01766 [Planoprotostelium fungivorum]